MLITEITLIGYRGLRLRKIQRLHWKISQKVQFILGSNGSGKSSLIGELSPLPASASDYPNGGQKIIHITHRKKQYVLDSRITDAGNSFSFYCDGEELNPGLTVTVYLELVKTHFNYTKDIHAVLTGLKRFDTMTVSERRAWFTLIADQDYTFAIRYFQKLKEKAKGLQGAQKFHQSRLIAESAKCLSPEEEAQLRTLVKSETQILNELLQFRKPKLPQSNKLKEWIDRDQSLLQKNAERLNALIERTERESFSVPIDQLTEEAIRLNHRVCSEQQQLAQTCERLDGIQKEIDIANQTSIHSAGEVQLQIQSLEEEQYTLRQQLKTTLIFEQPEEAKAALDLHRSGLEEILDGLIEMGEFDHRYTLDSTNQIRHLRNDIGKRLPEIQRLITEKETQIKLHERNKERGEVSCPQCQHAFTPGFQENHHKALLEDLTRQREIRARIEEKIAEYDQILIDRSRSDQLLSGIRLNAAVTPSLKTYWDFLWASEAYMDDPKRVLRELKDLDHDLTLQVRIRHYQSEIEQRQKLLEQIRNTKLIDREKLQARFEVEEKSMLQLQSQIERHERKRVQIKEQIALLNELNRLRENTEEVIGRYRGNLECALDDHLTSLMDEFIGNLRLRISKHERQLAQIDHQKGIVDMLEKNIRELTIQNRLLKQAIKALSPTEGLIAKSMGGFINLFLSNLNAFMNRIWTYPLRLEPVSMQEDSIDLDYQFPVRVNDDPIPTEDVKKTSSGMKEVIHLAFSIISMKHLGMEQFPIFLDEFAARMDHAHRQMAYQIIEYLTNSKDFSQIFIVSHYKDGYQNAVGAETIVLCDSNIELPEGLSYNSHIEMH